VADERQPSEPLLVIVAAVESLLAEARDAGDAERAATLEELRARLDSEPGVASRDLVDGGCRTL
jgi:hypothetical protein